MRARGEHERSARDLLLAQIVYNESGIFVLLRWGKAMVVRRQGNKKRDVSLTIVEGIAVVLAVATSLWLVLWADFYQVVIVKPDSEEMVRTSASLIEVNGYWVVLLFLVPLALAVAGFLSIMTMDPRRAVGKVAIWAPAVISLLLCAAGVFSIGLLYIPTSAALVAAAVVACRQSRVPQQ